MPLGFDRCRRLTDWADHLHCGGLIVAMAGVHHVLLLWFDIAGLCLPPLLLVSIKLSRPKAKLLADRTLSTRIPTAMTTTACVIAACSKSPRSQTAKQTTFGSSSFPL